MSVLQPLSSPESLKTGAKSANLASKQWYLGNIGENIKDSIATTLACRQGGSAIDPGRKPAHLAAMERIKAILVLVAAVGFALSPFLSPGFNGFRADQFPIPQIDPPAQPAGYAFAIWGLIYLMLILGAGYGLLNRGEHSGWSAGRWPLLASLAVGAA